MISLSIDENGKKKAPFTRPDVPRPEVVGTCEKCGGGMRFEEFTNWNATEGTTRKRIYRCTQHAGRCPAVTVTLGQDGQEEETMAKTKREGLVCLQTLEWCNQVKAAIIDKHLAYKDVAKDASISQSSLAQGLNMHMSLSEESQYRIEAAVAKAERWESVTARRMAEKRKAKAAADKMPPSLRVSGKTFEAIEAMAKETEETILRNLEAQEALPPGSTVTWGEEQPKPGLIQPSEELVIIDVTGPTTFLEEPPRPGLLQTEMLDVNPDNLEAALGRPTGTGRAEVVAGDLGGDSLEGCGLDPALDAEEIDLLAKSQILTPSEASRAADERMEKRPVGSTERHMLAMVSNYYDLVQRHKAVECKIDGVAELYYGLEQRHRALECRVQGVAEQAEQRNLDLEDRLTSTYDHLTEQIGNMAGLVGQPANEVPLLWRTVSPKPVDGFDFWLEEQRRNRPPSLDEVVDALSKYSDSQLAALVTAATARRDLLKAMEAA